MTAARFSFPRSRRITTPAEFEAVHSSKASVRVGPLLVRGCPNTLGHPRLGLSVSRRVGNAVVRNRNKRMLREAFRQIQHELPGAYDLVVSVRPHEPLTLSEYQHMLMDAARRLEGIWTKRNAKQTRRDRVDPSE